MVSLCHSDSRVYPFRASTRETEGSEGWRKPSSFKRDLRTHQFIHIPSIFHSYSIQIPSRFHPFMFLFHPGILYRSYTELLIEHSDFGWQNSADSGPWSQVYQCSPGAIRLEARSGLQSEWSSKGYLCRTDTGSGSALERIWEQCGVGLVQDQVCWYA